MASPGNFSTKSTIVGSALPLARKVESRLRRRGVVEFRASPTVRDVGLDFEGGGRRTVVVRDDRTAKATERLRHIATLSRAFAQ